MSVFIGGGAFAFTPPTDLASMKNDFKGFSTDVAKTLPFASTMGLNWSSAYIGKLFHFGVGVSGGAVFVPAQSFIDVMKGFGITAPPAVTKLTTGSYGKFFGIPLPSLQVEARLGGVILPFDVGVKFGTIPSQANLSAILPQGLNANFVMAGVQVRYQLVKEKFLIPQISVGVGGNHFQGTITYDTNLAPFTLSNFQLPDGTSHTLTVTSPALAYLWKTNTLDFQLEVSKTILFIVTPYAGVGVTIGRSYAGGGFSSNIQLDGSTLTQTKIDYYNQLYQKYGQSSPFSGFGTTQPGIYVGSSINNVVPRVFLGVSANLLFLKLDVTGMYNVMTGKLGATVGARAQF
jgi:hypothetical protein